MAFVQQFLVQKQRRRKPRQSPPVKPSPLHTDAQLLSRAHGPLNLWLLDSHLLASPVFTAISARFHVNFIHFIKITTLHTTNIFSEGTQLNIDMYNLFSFQAIVRDLF